MLTRGLGGTIEREKDYTTLSKERLFKKVLIANRGEIALRIIRACKELGINTVTIYSDSDKNSLAAKFSDKAYCIGSNNGYLDVNKIIRIAKKAKVDAIHPGYGFLAENAGFARLCQKNKIKFIGPSVKAINTMGNKVIAKDAILKAGIPAIPGTTRAVKDVDTCLRITNRIGYPVIIKAAAGGGGKGMRIVRSDEELEKAFKSAEAEAEASFGNKDLYIEKYFDDPRHIEFQILADKHGNVVHLGERDCSIQRRHQKLIEEAPSPALNKSLREKMGAIAVRVAKIAGYEGAGTVEFLIDDDKNFYFMEMNTRIQVEHGITEMITGVDLVKEQIKIASGAKLTFTQDDIKIGGWAIECRINAEDPSDNFTPSIGSVASYLPPGGPGIRVCSSCHSGHIVSPHYDSLIAKLMCGGRNRNEAINRTKRALSEFIIEGIDTTIPFHKEVLVNKEFVKGNATTSFIEKNKILDRIKKQRKKKRMTNGKKTLIIATAASEYMSKKYNGSKSSKLNPWVIAGRQELMSDERSF
ncbi:acetyl-CoA carboxylase biotin carboxylase subunit [Candidatus Woesearchaeota archaeon]|nr:acetyl-CoA carboxylase biotin carboxylase subunit [Candidatus Woesearchaeota archaeon]